MVIENLKRFLSLFVLGNHAIRDISFSPSTPYLVPRTIAEHTKFGFGHFRALLLFSLGDMINDVVRFFRKRWRITIDQALVDLTRSSKPREWMAGGGFTICPSSSSFMYKPRQPSVFNIFFA